MSNLSKLGWQMVLWTVVIIGIAWWMMQLPTISSSPLSPRHIYESEKVSTPPKQPRVNTIIQSSPARLSRPTQSDSNEQIATILNLNGLLCARVVEMRLLPLGKMYEVTCIAYRGGRATKSYVLNMEDGSAFERE